jgi:hypothetical protein
MLPKAVRCGTRTTVGSRDRDLQPGGRGQPVLGFDLQAEGVPGVAVRKVPQHDAVRLVPHRQPCGEPGEPVDRVTFPRFAEVQLVGDAVELVAAMVDAVGPRGEKLPGGTGWQFVRLVAEDQRSTAVAELAQSGTELGQHRAIVASGNLVLLTRDRYPRPLAARAGRATRVGGTAGRGRSVRSHACHPGSGRAPVRIRAQN